MPIASNPYRIEEPLQVDDVFIGREEAFAWITSRLGEGESVLALYGMPLIGKTSLLARLPALLGDGYRCLFCSPETLGENGLAAWERELEAELDALDLGGAQPLVIVDGLTLAGNESGMWGSLLGVCTRWDEKRGVSFLLGIQGSLAQARMMAGGAGSVFALGELPSMDLARLSLAESEALLVQVAGGQLVYDYDAVKRLFGWTGGHPYLLQLFGYALFELYERIGRVDIHAVERTVEQITAASERLFGAIWERLASHTKVALVALSQQHGRHDVFTKRDAQDFARWARVQIPAEHVEEALAEATAKGLLERMGADSYRVTMTLLTLWLRSRRDLSEEVRRSRRYRISAPPPVEGRTREPIRWTTIVSWMLSLLILAFIAWIWNTREEPTTPSLADQLVAERRATAESAPPTATPLPLQHLAFARKENKDAFGSIFTMLEDGTELRQLTDDMAEDESPAWSPDGRWLLFTTNLYGNRDVWVMDAEGERQQNLSRHPDDDWMPAWSPDGRFIAYASHRDGNWEIYVAKADGNDPVRLTEDEAPDLCPTWSADGERIAFASQRDGNWEIYSVGSDGDGLLRLTTNSATDFAPAWSPIGDEIAFETYRDGDMEVYLLSLVDGELTNLTAQPASNDHSPAWSRDGSRIAYHSNEGGGWDIWIINRDGTGKVNAMRTEALEQDPTWGP